MLDRRNFLKVGGAVGLAGVIGGAGLGTFSGSARAIATNISTNPVSVSNDRGDLSELTINPRFRVEWENLDDAVGKVFYLIEAKTPGMSEYQPIFRATPWLGVSQLGTTGSYTVQRMTAEGLRRLVVADEDGQPDYASWDWSNYGSSSLSQYLDGTSLGSASNYQSDGSAPVGNMMAPQNNFPSVDAGYYGAAMDTSAFDNPDDNGGEGSTKTTTVQLRYTIELQRPNFSQLEYRYTDNGNSLPSDYGNMTDAEKKQFWADTYSALTTSDIDAGNSKIVMNGEDGYHTFASPSGIPYDTLQANPGHVGVIVETASFEADVTNEGSVSGASGSTNGAAQ